jgi:uncharacterized membrane protein YjjP (DUF1212 family)
MNERKAQLAAYLATLATLALVFVAALVAAAIAPALIGKIEAFGLGTITGGLIGVLRLPQQRTLTIDSPPETSALSSPEDPAQTPKGRS